MTNLLAVNVDVRLSKQTIPAGSVLSPDGLLSASNLPPPGKVYLRAVTPRRVVKPIKLGNVRLRNFYERPKRVTNAFISKMR